MEIGITNLDEECCHVRHDKYPGDLKGRNPEVLALIQVSGHAT